MAGAAIVSLAMCAAVPAGAGTVAAACASDDGVHCFAPGSAGPAWQRLRGQVTHRLLYLDGDLVVGAASGVYRFSATGEERWRFAGIGAAFTPSTAPPLLIFGTLDGALVGVDADSGRQRWRTGAGGWMYSPAVFADRVVGGGQDAILRAFDRRDGAPLWSHPLDQELVHRPLAVGAGVLVTTFAGTIAMHRASDGAVLWRRRFSAPARSPVSSEGHLYSALFDGRVVALRARDGRVLWERALALPADLLPAGAVLLARDEAGLSALHPGDGRLLWQRDYGMPLTGLGPHAAGRVAVFARWRGEPHRLTISLRDGTRSTLPWPRDRVRVAAGKRCLTPAAGSAAETVPGVLAGFRHCLRPATRR